MSRQYDFIIFGATGFAGLYVVEEAVNCLKPESTIPRFTWAVAGRSEHKLQETLNEVTRLTGMDVKNVGKILANSNNMESLRQMAAQCSVVLNVVGPYHFHGEAVVQACLTEGTHHVDISGEAQFLEKIQVLYQEEAKAKGIYIVGSCGFGFISWDIGATYLQQKFGGEINSIESYTAPGLKSIFKGTGMNIGTWNSMVNYMAYFVHLKQLRNSLFPIPLPQPKYPASSNWPIHYNKDTNSWCMPLSFLDERVVARSQYLFYTEQRQRPIQFKSYLQFPFLIICLATWFAMGFYFILSQFKSGRERLLKYPRIFTCNVIKPGGPSRAQAENSTGKLIMSAYGWSEKLAEPTDHHDTPPNKKMRLIVYAENPTYRATAAMLLQSALTILLENDKMPSNGGVFPPGFAFAKTTLLPRIQSRGIEFRLINNW